MKQALDRGDLCILNYLENQLISGYDEQGFILLRSWENCEPQTEIATITAGTWDECLGKEGWAYVTFITRGAETEPILLSAREALQTAAELYGEGSQYQMDRYRIGKSAFETWIAGISAGLGSSHGHWWNATVWSECRAQAAEFFQELSELTDNEESTRLCDDLQAVCKATSAAIAGAGNREQHAAEQERLLRDAAAREAQAVGLMKNLAGVL